MSRKNVRRVFVEWLRSQNEGDFEAYKKLFAEDFRGLKRSGARTTHYNRRTWLADRATMFRTPTVVSASDITIKVNEHDSDIRFVQDWASGDYHDKGVKTLGLHLRDDLLRIGREEMIDSKLLSRDKQDDYAMYFMFEGSVVLQGAKVPTDTTLISANTGSQDSLRAIYATVKESDLAPEVRALKGKRVLVDGACTSEITGFRVVSSAVEHFTTVDRWTCHPRYLEDVGSEDCKPLSSREIAEEVFNSGVKYVVADLKDCKGSYAQMASMPLIKRAKEVRDKTLETKARNAFLQLDEVGQWERAGWKDSLTTNIYVHPTSGQTLVSVYAQSGYQCYDRLGISYSLWQLWEVSNAKLTPIATGDAPTKILAVIDANGDGVLEFVVAPHDITSYSSLVDSHDFTKIWSHDYTYLDDPC